MSENESGGGARLFLLASVAVTLLIYFVPYGQYIGYPLVLLSTLAHEMGHGVTAVLVGGEFDSLKMFSDASGVAGIRVPDSRIASAMVSAGGLCGPAVVAALLFIVSARQKLARFALGAVAIFLIGSVVLVVRNPFGIVFVLILAALLAAVAFKASAKLAQIIAVFFGAQLALSVYSRGDYLFTDVAQTAQGESPSDVAHMADALFLPYWFWGAACGLFSVLVVVLGIWLFFRATRTREEA